MTNSLPLLSLLVWLPLLGGLLVLAMGEGRAPAARWLSLAIALLSFALSVVVYWGFDNTTSDMQFQEFAP